MDKGKLKDSNNHSVISQPVCLTGKRRESLFRIILDRIAERDTVASRRVIKFARKWLVGWKYIVTSKWGATSVVGKRNLRTGKVFDRIDCDYWY